MNPGLTHKTIKTHQPVRQHTLYETRNDTRTTGKIIRASKRCHRRVQEHSNIDECKPIKTQEPKGN